MSRPAKLPETGRVAYAGPALTSEAIEAVGAAGYEIVVVGQDQAELPAGTAVLVYGLEGKHPHLSALQRDAVAADIQDVPDLAFLGQIAGQLRALRKQRALVTGSAGKSFTAALLRDMSSRAKLDAKIIGGHHGYLNALGAKEAYLILTAVPSAVRHAERIGFGACAVLNLTEEAGHSVSNRAKAACAAALTASELGVLGTDDSGAQSLLMAVRRLSGSSAREVLPVSGGSTLSGGFFAIDRVLYAAKMGRTRRAANFTEAGALIGDHFGQSVAAASALAAGLGCTDEQIEAALLSFSGLPGRFECVGTRGRIVFVDDHAARTSNSAALSIAACPDVFWIGHEAAQLPRRVKDAMRGTFTLRGADGSGPPLDRVTSFDDPEEAVSAALHAAEELLLREPDAAPVLLFAPGAPGFDEAAASFRKFVSASIGEGGRLHA